MTFLLPVCFGAQHSGDLEKANVILILFILQDCVKHRVHAK